jgi:hypothetical protein
MLNLLTLRRILALILLTIVSSFASASSQPAILAFSSPALSGSFDVKIESTTQVLLAITSVSLSIDGYKFKTKDIGFRYDAANNITFIAGLANGLDYIVAGPSSDFYIVWTPATGGGYFALISYTSGPQVLPLTQVQLTITARNADKGSDLSQLVSPSENEASLPASEVADSHLGVFALIPVNGSTVMRGSRQRTSA